MPAVEQRAVLISRERRDTFEAIGQMLCREAQDPESYDWARDELGKELLYTVQAWDKFGRPPERYGLDVDTHRKYEPETEAILLQEAEEREEEARRLGTWG